MDLDFANMKLVDLLIYAPYLLGSLFGLLIVWKLGKLGFLGARVAASAPAKTAGVLGTMVSLGGTPVAVTRLMDVDPGMAVGSAGMGAFVLLLSAMALIRGKPADPLILNKKDRKAVKNRLEMIKGLLSQVRETGDTDLVHIAQNEIQQLQKLV